MELIAVRDIYNNVGVKIDGAVHENIIHKGAIFKLDDEDKIAELKAARAIGSADDSELVALVKKEVAADKKREAAAAKSEA